MVESGITANFSDNGAGMGLDYWVGLIN